LTGAERDYRLVDALKNRDRATAEALLRSKADVNVARADGTTALHWAAQWNDVEAAGLLIKAGANVNAQTDLGIAPITLACTNGSSSMVQALVQAGANANIAKATGETALMTCSRSGNQGAVEALLAHGANVGATEPVQGQNALMWAAAENHSEVVRALIAHGADVQVRTKGAKYTPLLFASRNGAADAVGVLLSSGADVNESAADGTTPLIAATYTGHWGLARFLLDHGADPNRSDAGYTALHWAAGSWENDISGNLGPDGYEWIAGRGPGKLELVKALLAHGADPNARLKKRPPRYGYGSGSRLNFSGATPFLLAALGGETSIMKELLAAGADAKLTADDGSTALMTASGYGRIHGESRTKDEEALEAARLALETGIDVNASNRNGQTALHGAAYFQSDPVAQFLIDHGAKVNARNRAGETPLVIAEGYKGTDTGDNTFYSDSMAALLRKAGGVRTMEFSSVINRVETACPSPMFLVADQDASSRYGEDATARAAVRIKTTDAIQFKNAKCEDLKPGTRVRIVGTRLGHLLDKNGLPWDGSVDASEIEIVQ
jgi:ankyrin repeat protein